MKKLTASVLVLLLCLLGVGLGPPSSMAAAVVTYDFLANASSASWNGWTPAGAKPITFGLTSWTFSDGNAAIYNGLSMEDGNKYSPALWMVCPGGTGTAGSGVTGDYYHVYIPANASLHVVFGLTKGNTGETGIVVGVAFADDDPSYPLVELINETKDFDGSLREVTVDLSGEGGRTGGFQLFVRTAHADDADSAVWVKAVLEVTTPTPAPTLTVVPIPTSLVLRFFVGSTTYSVDGTSKSMDTAPVIVESRTFLPIRYVVEEIGGKVAWSAPDQKVTITFGSKTIELWIGNNRAIVDGKLDVPIDSTNSKVAPFIQPPGRTMMPLRFVSETLGCKVDWVPPGEVQVTYPAP